MSHTARVKSASSRIGSFFIVIIIFIGLGPLVGSLAVWIAASVSKLVAADGNIGSPGPVGYFAALWLVLFFGYVIGIGYALVAGILVAVAGIWVRWNNLFVPFMAALAASLIGSYIVTLYYFRPLTNDWTITGIFPICLVATLVCWYVTRGIVRATWQSA
jgi:hypothetical protein